MFLSDRDVKWAIECGKLIVDPPPSSYDENSIDLQLDSINNARVWNPTAVEEVRTESRRLGGSALRRLVAVPLWIWVRSTTKSSLADS